MQPSPEKTKTPAHAYSAADPQHSVPKPVALCDWPRHALLMAAARDTGSRSRQTPARTSARPSSRGERDAHSASPKRLHAVRPLDRHIARSLTIAILDEAGVNHWAHGLPGKVSPEEARWFVWGPWEFNTGPSAQVTDKQDHPAAVILQAGRQELGPARPDTYPARPLDGADDPGAVAAPASRAGPVADHLRPRWRAVDPAPRGPGSRAATGAGKVTIDSGTRRRIDAQACSPAECKPEH